MTSSAVSGVYSHVKIGPGFASKISSYRAKTRVCMACEKPVSGYIWTATKKTVHALETDVFTCLVSIEFWVAYKLRVVVVQQVLHVWVLLHYGSMVRPPLSPHIKITLFKCMDIYTVKTY